MVPAYTAAAFAKRMARRALWAPPAGALIAIAFIHNILRRHPSCAVLLHNPHVCYGGGGGGVGDGGVLGDVLGGAVVLRVAYDGVKWNVSHAVECFAHTNTRLCDYQPPPCIP